MTRADNLRAVLLWESIADEAKAKAAQAREALTADATTELTEQGSAPSWRFAGLGLVTLPVTKASLAVARPAELLAWVQQQHPTEVELVPTIRPAFLAALGKRVVVEEDMVIDPATGEIVPGYAVLPGGAAKALTIRPDADAKGQMRADAAALVERMEAAVTGEVSA
ncbi:hypothetical protein [Catellatospora coxensis]|uniref:Uncharacterized protein n=1 Tax=Catellatospora coxensis TaxID=310354 RepID=A0A8J3L1N9_9ACTN|nr:hypothetical protein [Catellatospora coxensis]GIG10183.1 hypothetical protein Cco03nite_68830 [Catellatospora coxensis]